MKASALLHQRSSGVLLHPTSLPGGAACGDLGPAARQFVDFLAAGKQRWWQMLPVNPPGSGDSPYNAISAFAGSPLLISSADLAQEGLLTRAQARAPGGLPQGACDYPAAWQHRQRCILLAHAALLRAGHAPLRNAFSDFRARQRALENGWLADFALYRAISGSRKGRPWYTWPAPLRLRQPAALASARKALAPAIEIQEFQQFLFHRQWQSLRRYARERGVLLLGDLPIFVSLDSADVWAHPELFQLNARGRPTVVAGVPPDAFSRTGQRWGNPLYRWAVLRRHGYAWWVQRAQVALQRFDVLRLDHFIGFQRHWEVPARARTALPGRYRPGPRDALFQALRAAIGDLPFVAEDLGVVTAEVTALRERFDLPGLRVLQFAFDGDPRRNTNLPHHFPRHCVVYTGTHDNDTTRGWYEGLLASSHARDLETARRVREWVAEPRERVPWGVLRVAMESVANVAMVPAQDLLGLDTRARMNQPGTPSGNWRWRLLPGQLSPAVARRLGAITEATGRASEFQPADKPIP